MTITGNVNNIIKDNFGAIHAIMITPNTNTTICLINSAREIENADCSCSTSAVNLLVSSPTLFFQKENVLRNNFSKSAFRISAIPYSLTFAKMLFENRIGHLER